MSVMIKFEIVPLDLNSMILMVHRSLRALKVLGCRYPLHEIHILSQRAAHCNVVFNGYSTEVNV